VSQLYSLIENFQSEHRKLKKDQTLFWREKRERKNAWKNKSAQKQHVRERERDDIFALLRVIQNNHPRTATNESEEELVIGNIFSRSPLGEFFRL